MAILMTAPTTFAAPSEATPQSAIVTLAPPLRERLVVDVAKEKAIAPNAFARVESIVARSAALEAATRGRRGATALELAAVGTAGVLPMLERLAVRGGDRPVVRRAMMEALGRIRDERSLAVLAAVMSNGHEEPETVRTATEALGRLNPAAAETAILRALQTASGRSATAILEGMGSCRTNAIAQALVSALETSTDTERTVAVMRSLGRVGNAWAWSTSKDREHEIDIRNAAAKALIAAFVRHEGYPQSVASDAIMVVDAPLTSQVLNEALAHATSSQATALRELSARLARNPARPRP